MIAGVISASPSARVRTAVILIKGHNIGVLPIVEANDTVVGVVTRHHLLGEPDDIAVSEVMSTDFTTVEPHITVAEAAEIMRKAGTSSLLVMDHSKLVGIISYSDLVPELGKTYDPLTGLPWSDTFREWAMTMLKQGVEITIVFFDLDNFGMLNKLHGHVAGDRALIDVVGVMRQSVDYDTDCVCRYGGDEFAIVTIRSYDDSEQLAQKIQEGIAAIKIPDVPEGITGTFGIAGGRRTEERKDTHYAATIDNLITKASKHCMSRKPPGTSDNIGIERHGTSKDVADPVDAAIEENVQESSQPAPVVRGASAGAGQIISGRLNIDSVSATTSGAVVKAIVRLSSGGIDFVGEASAFNSHSDGITRVAAEACANALCSYLPAGHAIQLEDYMVATMGGRQEVATCMLTYVAPGSVEHHSGSAIVRMGDKNRAAAACVLSAVNRRLGTLQISTADKATAPAQPRPTVGSDSKMRDSI